MLLGGRGANLGKVGCRRDNSNELLLQIKEGIKLDWMETALEQRGRGGGGKMTLEVITRR